MNRTITLLILLCVFLQPICQEAPTPKLTAEEIRSILYKKTPWKDGKGITHTGEELDQILAQHTLWLNTKGKQGVKARFFQADLRGEQLSDTDLRKVDFTFADLSGAKLVGTDLTDALLLGTKLNGTFLIQTKMDNTDMVAADVAGAYFEPSTLPDVTKMARVQNLYVSPTTEIHSLYTISARSFTMPAFSHSPP